MRILYVEDDPLNRRVVRDMLAVAGADMAEAPDAPEGLRLIDEDSFDLVLIDLRMPGMDGLDLIRRVRGRADDKRNLPLIVITAETGTEMESRCVEAGADELLTKPVAMKALFDAIGRVAVSRGTRASL